MQEGKEACILKVGTYKIFRSNRYKKRPKFLGGFPGNYPIIYLCILLNTVVLEILDNTYKASMEK